MNSHWAVVLGALTLGGCNTVLGLDERPPRDGGGGGDGGFAAGGGGEVNLGGGGAGGTGGAPIDYADALAVVWGQSFGGVGFETAQEVAVHPSGDAIIAGAFDASLTMGGFTLTSPARGLFISRLGWPGGEPVFALALGNTDAAAESLLIAELAVDDAGDVYAIGYFEETLTVDGQMFVAQGSNDAFVLKADGDSGDLIWLTHITGTSWLRGSGVAFSPSGDMFITGYYAGSFSCGGAVLPAAPRNTVFVSRVNPGTGVCVDPKVVGAGENEHAHAIVAASDDEIFITGSAEELVHASGQCAFTGRGGFVMSLDGSLDQTGVSCFGDTMEAWFHGALSARTAMSPADVRVALAGYYFNGELQFAGGPMFALGSGYNGAAATLDGSLGHVQSWSSVPSVGTSVLQGVVHDTVGDAVFVGHTNASEIDFGSGPVVNGGNVSPIIHKRDAAGALLWADVYPISGTAHLHAVAAGEAGSIWVTGELNAQVTWNGVQLSAAGATDAFVMRLEPVPR